MKPENILIDEDGYIKLTDFGLSRFLDEQELAMSFCGTAEYMSPEMIDKAGHDNSTDWWSLGVLLYEMIIGCPPFYHKDRNKMFEMIKNKPP